jgi:hypothetical protein
LVGRRNDVIGKDGRRRGINVDGVEIIKGMGRSGGDRVGNLQGRLDEDGIVDEGRLVEHEMERVMKRRTRSGEEKKREKKNKKKQGRCVGTFPKWIGGS